MRKSAAAGGKSGAGKAGCGANHAASFPGGEDLP